jgi:hypothetical protein
MNGSRENRWGGVVFAGMVLYVLLLALATADELFHWGILASLPAW